MSDELLVVVAHPDDEILWLCPAVARASTILAAFPTHLGDPTLSSGRASVRAEYPLPGFEFLPLSESGAFRRSDWLRRAPVNYGVTLSEDCPVDTASRYVENYSLLLELLDSYVRRHQNIYTHNLWGEYGHEEHIQVSSAVVTLAHRHGCSVWAWDGRPEWRLMLGGMRLRRDYYQARLPTLPHTQMSIDVSLYRSIQQLYVSRGAWTAKPTYQPPSPSTYIQLVNEGSVLLTPGAAPKRLRYVSQAEYVVPQKALRALRGVRRRIRGGEIGSS
jgi:hypothetical protein